MNNFIIPDGPSMLDGAIRCAQLGLRLFPLFGFHDWCDCGHACLKPGKHPRIGDWAQNATDDESTLHQWFGPYPESNIAAYTHGYCIIDIDPRHGGDKTFAQILRDTDNTIPDTWRVASGGGGVHIWFRDPSCKITSGTDVLGPGVDVRATGGYIIMPPSMHESGNRYSWLNDPSKTPLADLPVWIRTRLKEEVIPEEPEVLQADLMGSEVAKHLDVYDPELKVLLYRALTKCHSGQGRHDACLWLSCQLRDQRFRRDVADIVVKKYASLVPIRDHPYRAQEALYCVQSVYKDKPRKRIDPYEFAGNLLDI